MEYRLELVIVPVTDVDRAKAFYTDRMGFSLDVDHRAGGLRVVQLTPPGSPCSITIGTGVTDAEPGSVRGLHLVVTDIVAACAELDERGVQTEPVKHMTASGWVAGPDPGHSDFNSFSGFVDPDGNSWVLQERGHR